MTLIWTWRLIFPVVLPRQVESLHQWFFSLSQNPHTVLLILLLGLKVETSTLHTMASASFPRKMRAGPALGPGATGETREGEEAIQRQYQQEDLALEGKGQIDDKHV